MSRSLLRLLVASSLLVPSVAFAGGGGGEVITNIAIAIVAASAAGFVVKVLRQPLLLGYLLGGVLVGPVGLKLISDREAIETISAIGLILLLFMIGLEIDLKKMLAAGKLVVIPGLLQFPLSVGLAFAILKLLQLAGQRFGEGRYAILYLAVALSISSTMIVVKLLYDRRELDTLPGRITVGILVFQDIWAIIVLAVQPSISNPDVVMLARTFGAGALLVLGALLVTRYVLPLLFRVVAKVPELLTVLSLGWCFLVGLVAAHPLVGLSMEMGALIAGVAMATFPYNLDVIAKVLNIRDFFITLFFVSLGMQIPLPTTQLLLGAASLSVLLFLTRLLGVFAVLHRLGAGHRAAILPAVSLSQMSEFSLVILAIGISAGHIGQRTLSIAIWTFAILAVLAPYVIGGADALVRVGSAVLSGLGIRDLRTTASEVRRGGDRPVVMLGFFRIAESFLEDILTRDQHLVEQLKVVDFNPEVRARLTALGVPVVYGDISSADTLHHAHLEHARVVISSVPDSMLRGTTNAKLMKVIREVCPKARVVVTAETPAQALALYNQGADFVLQPAVLAGSSLVTVVEQAMRGSTEAMKQEAKVDLVSRTGSHAILPPA